jgi:hypothetical protein
MTKTKRALRVLIACFAVSGILFISGCATVIRTKPSEKNLELAPSAGQGTALLVRITDSGKGARIGESADFDVIIDGEKVDTIARNQRMRIAVPNGAHTISVKESGGVGVKSSSPEETFTVNSDETVFHIYLEGVRGNIILKQ